MSPRRLAALVFVVGGLVAGALLPSAGCNGTGTTPVCDFPDGANNPESGCGELVEAAAEDAFSDGAVETTDAGPAVDSGAPSADASDSGARVDAGDAGHHDGGATDGGEDAGDAADGGIADAHHDGAG